MRTVKKSLSLSLAAAAFLAATPGTARAQSLNAQTLLPASGTSYIHTEDALLTTRPGEESWTGTRWTFGAQYNLLHNPLVAMNRARSARTGLFVDSFHTLDVSGGVIFDRKFAAGLNIPLSLVTLPGQSTKPGLGDIRLVGKWRFTDDAGWMQVALVPELSLPTGSSGLYLSNGSVGAGASLAAEKDFGLFQVAANAGVRVNPGAILEDIDYRTLLPVSLGAMYKFNDAWAAVGEASGALAVPFSKYNNPSEYYLGARFQIDPETVAAGGFAFGALDSKAAGDFRFIIGVKFTPIPEYQVEPKLTALPLAVSSLEPPMPDELRLSFASPEPNYYRKLTTTKTVVVKKASSKSAKAKKGSKSGSKKSKGKLAKKARKSDTVIKKVVVRKKSYPVNESPVTGLPSSEWPETVTTGESAGESNSTVETSTSTETIEESGTRPAASAPNPAPAVAPVVPAPQDEEGPKPTPGVASIR